MYSDDITEQFYDLKTRLETKKVLQERLSGYLKNAKNTEDRVRIERELNSCISEIETMEGRMRRMQNQIDFSTINIELQLPYRTTTKGFEFPSLSNGLRKFGGNLLDFFILLLQAVCYITICGIPLVALVAFLFWLLFGKIGLLKKLFKKLK